MKWENVDGWFTRDDARTLRWLIDRTLRLGPGPIVEIGTFQGRSTMMMALAYPHVAIVTVDPYIGVPGHAVKGRELARAAAENLNPFRNVTRVYLTSDEYAARVPDRSVNLVFIDGDHSEPAVRVDIEAWTPKIRPGGILCGHDFDSESDPGVVRAVTDLCAGYQVDGRMWWWVTP